MHAAAIPLLSKSKAETRKSPRITMLPNALSGGLVTRFVASKYLPWFPAKERYARLRLPCSGSRVVSTSPPYRMPLQHSSVLRSAKTAKSPSRETSLREAIVARYLACTRFFVSLPVHYRGRLAAAPKCNSTTAPGLLVSRYTSASGYLARRQMALPSSQATLMRTCPGLRPRWCPEHSPMRTQDCCLPRAFKPSAFSSQHSGMIIQ